MNELDRDNYHREWLLSPWQKYSDRINIKAFITSTCWESNSSIWSRYTTRPTHQAHETKKIQSQEEHQELYGLANQIRSAFTRQQQKSIHYDKEYSDLQDKTNYLS